MKDRIYIDPKLEMFLSAAKPGIRRLFEDLIENEGYEQGLYTFQQILAELVARIGITAATVICIKPTEIEKEMFS